MRWFATDRQKSKRDESTAIIGAGREGRRRNTDRERERGRSNIDRGTRIKDCGVKRDRRTDMCQCMCGCVLMCVRVCQCVCVAICANLYMHDIYRFNE